MSVRDADELVAPALRETIAALKPPASDNALVRLAEVVAATIDELEGGQRGMMLGQTAPMLLKVLVELEARAVKRRAAEHPAGRVNKVAQIRGARAAADVKRRRAG